MTSRAPLIGLLVALLLGVAFWFLLYKPLGEEQVAVQDETAQLEGEQQTLRRRIAELEAIQAQEVQIRATLTRLDEYLPSAANQATVIRQLQIAADAAGVTIRSLAFQTAEVVDGAPASLEPGTALTRIPVTMVLDAGYFQAVDFFRRLEQDIARAILMTDLAMAESDNEFPALATTWGGSLFAVLPVVPEPEPTPTPGATPAEGETPASGASPSPSPSPGASS